MRVKHNTEMATGDRVQEVSEGDRVQPQTTANKPRRRWMSVGLTSGAVLFGLSAIAGGAWVGIRLMLDPNSVEWVNRFLPSVAQLPVPNRAPPQTLLEIQAEIRELGLIPGKPLRLQGGGTLSGGRTDLLFPVYLKKTACQYQCQPIIELRVYRADRPFILPGQEKTYRLASQVAVQGVDATLALGPLAESEDLDLSSQGLLPVTDVQRFSGTTPEAGIWLYLSGTRSQADRLVAYGHILQYAPSETSLYLLSQWSSTDGNAPSWQQITGDKTPELVANQSIGMEPRFQVTQLEDIEGTRGLGQLNRLSLEVPALNHPAYRAAMRLAQGGLWSPALASLQNVKKQKMVDWSAEAQAQLDLIRLHAEVTAAQANQAWVSPEQQIQALLIDGRWSEALKLLKASAQENESAIALLPTSEQLWQRVEAALAVNSSNPDIRIWGALILGAKESPAKGMAWLRRQGTSGTAVAQVNRLLQRAQAAKATAAATAAIPDHASQIVGTAHLLNQLNPSGWMKPSADTPLTLDSQQHWYQIQVTRFHDGQRWQHAPFQLTKAKTAPYLWKLLGLNTDNRLQILVWTANDQHAIAATVKAARLQNNQLWLLAAADGVPADAIASASNRPRPFAFSDTALQWHSPDTTTLAQLAQEQPEAVRAIVPDLWRELQRGQHLSGNYNPHPIEKQQQLGSLPVQRLDLTNDQQVDVIITIDRNSLAEVTSTLTSSQVGHKPLPAERTVIFSSGGRLLYSEFSRDAGHSLVGIVSLDGSALPALALSGPQQYRLKQWSAARQQFE